jgi:caffeoyl-CoA O-methyltransferase
VIRALIVAIAAAGAAMAIACAEPTGAAPQPQVSTSLDRRVQAFLERRRGSWHDLNVPDADGRTLHELIVQHRFTRALEIGTSTGHSGIWIAWALAKTGGKLITVEIDPGRHRQAIANFTEAGLSDFVDARLGDAHRIVPSLTGPFDFVFSDADKEWYTAYFKAVWPKMTEGGCFTAHNVASRQSGIAEFVDYLKTVRNGTTTINRASSAGLSITCTK